MYNTNPPVGPWNTTSDIQFSPNNDYLLVTIKGTTFAPAGSGYGKNIIFPIVDGKVTGETVVNTIPGMHLNFGFSWLPDNRVIISDFPDYVVATIDPTNFTMTATNNVTVPGAMGLCWSVYSPRFDTIFLSDGFLPNITMVDPTTGEMKGVIVQNPDGNSGVDMSIDRNYLYVLRGNSNITVHNLTGLNSKGKANLTIDNTEFQNFVVEGNRKGFTGLAVYPSS